MSRYKFCIVVGGQLHDAATRCARRSCITIQFFYRGQGRGGGGAATLQAQKLRHGPPARTCTLRHGWAQPRYSLVLTTTQRCACSLGAVSMQCARSLGAVSAQCARSLGHGCVHCVLYPVLTQCTVLSHCLDHCS